MVSENQIVSIDDSIKGLTTNYEHLIDKSNQFLQIFSRAGDPDAKSLVEFHTLTEKHLKQIADKMPEINRATKAFGKQNTQVTGRLMSLTMLGTSAYHRLKQCLAKIERKRGALKENIYRLRKDKISLDRLIHNRKQLLDLIEHPVEDTTENDLKELNWDVQMLDIEIEEKIANLCDSNIYVEAALKEIGHYQTAYEQILKNNNIPENWNEKDFEEGEVEEHVKMAFLHCVRDVMMTGRLNVGSHEYLEQFGIHPYTAFLLVQGYLGTIEKDVNNNKFPSIESLYEFLDQMHENFKGEYLKAVKRIGLDHLLDDDFLYNKTEFTE